MSVYTTKVLDILRNYALPETNQTFDELIDATYQDYFNFDFPWYAPNDKGKVDFEKLFLLHYLMYEIGQETIELHRAMLASRLREIMPYYSGVYESLNVDMAWGENVNMVYDGTDQEEASDTSKITNSTTQNSNTDKKSNSESSTNTNETTTQTQNETNNTSIDGSSTNTVQTDNTTNTQKIDSDNPQVNFSGNDYASSMERGVSEQDTTVSGKDTNTATEESSRNNEENKVANSTSTNTSSDSDTISAVLKIDTNNNAETNINKNSTSKRLEKGYRGLTRGEVVSEMRDAIYNINLEIIKNCSDSFMLIY